jgi:HEAT repeat protein
VTSSRFKRTLWSLAATCAFLIVLAIGALALVPKYRVQLLGVYHSEPFFGGMPSRYWVDELSASWDQERLDRARLALRQGGPESMPILIEALRTPSDDARRQSAMLLAELGPNAEKAIPALLAEALRLCPSAEQDEGTVRVRVFESNAAIVKRQAAEQSAEAATVALTRVGRTAIPPVLNALEDESYDREAAVVRIISGIMRRSPVEVEFLFEQIQHTQNPQVHRVLAKALRESDSSGRIPPAELVEAVSSDSPDLRRFAVQELAAIPDWIGPADNQLVTSLISVLRRDDLASADAAATILVRLGQQSVAGLVHAFNSDSPAGKEQILGLLDKIGPEAIGALITDQDAAAKVSAIEFVQSRVREKNAFPVLSSLLRDSEPAVRISALEALAKLHWPNDLPVRDLVDLFPGGDEKTCKLLARCLIKARSQSTEVNAGLSHFLKDERPWVRFHTAFVLCHTDPKRPDVFAIVVEGLKSNPTYFDDNVFEMLESNAQIAKAAAGPLVAQLAMEIGTRERPRETDIVFVGNVLRALRKIEVDSPDAIPIFIDVLDVETLPGPIYADALRLLAQFGPRAKPKLADRLVKATDDRLKMNIVFGVDSGAGELRPFFSEIIAGAEAESLKRKER